jgi:hypothetical protein
MFPTRFETAVPASEQPQTHALRRATGWIGKGLSVLACIKGVQMNVHVFLILVLDGDDLGDLGFGSFNLSSTPENSRLQLYTGDRETSRCLCWESYRTCTDMVSCFNDFFVPLAKD